MRRIFGGVVIFFIRLVRLSFSVRQVGYFSNQPSFFARGGISETVTA